MAHGFDMYNVFLSAPGDLERDRDICRRAIGETNEQFAMPHKMLLVSVGLTNDEQIVGFRSAVADNIRWSSFYIQVFEDDWGPKNLMRKMFYLAQECRDNASQKMREVVVYLKAAPRENDPEILAFRKELAECPGIRVFHYSELDGLKSQVRELAAGWVRDILAEPRPGAETDAKNG